MCLQCDINDDARSVKPEAESSEARVIRTVTLSTLTSRSSTELTSSRKRSAGRRVVIS